MNHHHLQYILFKISLLSARLSDGCNSDAEYSQFSIYKYEIFWLTS